MRKNHEARSPKRRGWQYWRVTSLDAPLYNVQGFTLWDVIGEEDKQYHLIETRLDLSQAWSQLNEMEKWILYLIFVEGESQRTAAHRLAISQITVSQTMRYALEKLKQALFEPLSSYYV
ncbi:sigma factor-like helix-turn-helix DNA-binding protein [Neobacillus sp. NPDC058068]|uniref:sigma factor-like helix-turn-helix DNA-binding protein n=1 Tax=Neobacillus sp. NPDC058068 TaxID=3346325 RepID=UPI0036DB1883